MNTMQVGQKSVRKEMATDQMDLLQEIHKAHEEWQAAQNYFDNVSDPELVDYAIYGAEAARRKYIYLMKVARNIGIRETRFVI